MVELLLPKNSKVKSGKNFELKEQAKNKKVFLIYRYNPDTKEVIWYADEEFKHDSDVCEKCMAKKLKFSVYDKCDDTNFQKGLIIFHGKIIDEKGQGAQPNLH